MFFKRNTDDPLDSVPTRRPGGAVVCPGSVLRQNTYSFCGMYNKKVVNKKVAALKLPKCDIVREAGFSQTTLNAILRGDSVTYANAEKLAQVLGHMGTSRHRLPRYFLFRSVSSASKKIYLSSLLYSNSYIMIVPHRDDHFRTHSVTKKLKIASAYAMILLGSSCRKHLVKWRLTWDWENVLIGTNGRQQYVSQQKKSTSF